MSMSSSIEVFFAFEIAIALLPGFRVPLVPVLLWMLYDRDQGRTASPD